MAHEPFMIDRPGSHLGITTTDPGIGTAAELEAATISEFTDGDFTCAIGSATLTPTGGSATQEQIGTMCRPARTVPILSESSWTLDVTLEQDAGSTPGIQEYLADNDGLEGWVYVSTGNDDKPPKWLAHVELRAAAVGGAPAVPLTADVSFRLLEKPLFCWRSTVPLAAEAEAADAPAA